MKNYIKISLEGTVVRVPIKTDFSGIRTMDAEENGEDASGLEPDDDDLSFAVADALLHMSRDIVRMDFLLAHLVETTLEGEDGSDDQEVRTARQEFWSAASKLILAWGKHDARRT